MADKTDYAHLLRRYESLKRQWFSRRTQNEKDEDGEEQPNCVDRALLAQMFERMGCEIPSHPKQEFTPRAGGSAELVYD